MFKLLDFNPYLKISNLWWLKKKALESHQAVHAKTDPLFIPESHYEDVIHQENKKNKPQENGKARASRGILFIPHSSIDSG